MTEISWGDSSPEDPFDDDSWMSEPESVCNNWRGWKKNSTNPNQVPNGPTSGSTLGGGPSGAALNPAGSSASTSGGLLNQHVTGDGILVAPSSMSFPVASGGGAGSGGMTGSTANRPSTPPPGILISLQDGTIPSLLEISARVVAYHISFEVVERVCSKWWNGPVPEQLQLRIAYWSFPDNEEDIRLYSCLANGSADEFQKGESLYRCRSVQNLLQIGFHLSATVVSPSIKTCTVAVTFDRCRITSCNCTCASPSSWCSHVVAVCLHRIYQPGTVCLRAPVSESLTRLTRDQLQKFAQYLISESPQQILPTAQRLLDDLLLNENSDINQVRGAPDPTAGAPASELTKWCLDESQLHENIRKIVIKLCIPSPMVYSDVNYLSSAAPPAAAEWTSLLRPLRGREPEGLWNLLSIVREMLRRHDRNAVPLLKILTEELLSCDQILLWWFTTNVSLHRGYPPSSHGSGGGGGGNNRGMHSNMHSSQHACSSLCDEIAFLWRLVTLNPALTELDTQSLFEQLREYHLKTLSVIHRFKPSVVLQNGANGGSNSSRNFSAASTSNVVAKQNSDLETFSGFKPAMVSCLIDWDSYPIPGVTSQRKSRCHVYAAQMACSTSPVTHAITGTMVKLNHCMFKSGEGSREDKTNSDADKLNDSNSNSEDSGNQEFWERAFSSSSDSEDAGVAGPSMIQDKVNDDYQIYVYNTNSDSIKAKNVDGGEGKSDASYEPALISATEVKPIEDSFEILFARAEALYAHGYVEEAARLAVLLAEELLQNPPVLKVDPADQPAPPPPPPGPSTSRGHSKRVNRVRFNPALHQVSLLASATLSKAAFLCQVLLENRDTQLLAFRVGLFGLELVRPPASTRALEVKLAYQEQELVNFLKRIPLCQAKAAVLRDKAEQLRDGRITTRGDALLPLSLASYLFEALAFYTPQNNPTDERLAFDAAVAAIGLKANVSEADHPLLCEGTRRQRGDLALTLLVHYKDDKDRLNKIMDKLLDQEIHQIHRKPSGSYLAISQTTPATTASEVKQSSVKKTAEGDTDSAIREAEFKMILGEMDDVNGYMKEITDKTGQMSLAQQPSTSGPDTTSSDNSPTVSRRDLVSYQVGKQIGSESSSSAESSSDSLSSASSTKVRKVQNQSPISQASEPSVGNEVGYSSSMDATTSHAIAVGKSRGYTPRAPLAASPLVAPPVAVSSYSSRPSSSNFPSNSIQPVNCFKPLRYKGKRGHYPVIPNQPSEASAHFMFELAKTVLAKAGGNISSALFREPPTTQNCRMPHRYLHMCAFQIGLYALGLHNAVSSNWLSRTYSSHVSWITCQAMEIGHQAISFLIDTWEGHLTPTEVALLADRASKAGQEPQMVAAAAQLALSCLPHAHALPPSEIQRALIQCKEQSTEMLERACLAVESAAQGGGVSPEVLFEVARKWYELYETEKLNEINSSSSTQDESSHSVVFDQPVAALDLIPVPPTSQAEVRLIDQSEFYEMPHYNPGVEYQPEVLLDPNLCPPSTSSSVVSSVYSQYPPGYGPQAAYQFQTPVRFYGNGPPPTYPPYVTLPGTRFPPCQYATYQSQPQTGSLLPIPPGYSGPTNFYYPMMPATAAATTSKPSLAPGPFYMATTSPMIRPQFGYLTTPYGPAGQSNGTPAATFYSNTGPYMIGHMGPMVSAQTFASPAASGSLMSVPVTSNQSIHGPRQLSYMHASYRVGMLAMETLARRVHDDRPQAKFSRNPSYGEDVKWLLQIAKKLGSNHVQEFCMCALNAVASPFVLYDIVMEAAQVICHPSPSNNSPYMQTIRSQILQPLIHKCQQMFTQCIYFHVMHITSSDYDEFLSTLRSARAAFLLIPNGNLQFNELLQSVKRTKTCKKELWQLISNAMQT